MNTCIEKSEKKTKKSAASLVLLCAITYFVSYITRLNYSAVLLEIQNATDFSREALSVAVTGLSVCYGAGQLVSGFLGDRINPRYLIGGGLCLTACMNALLPFCPNTTLMTVVWCINGMAQAMMWPPIVKVLSANLSTAAYQRACVKVCYGSALGTVAVYALSPLIIHTASWKAVFFVASTAAVVMAIVVFLKMPLIDMHARHAVAEQAETDRSEKESEKASTKGKISFGPALPIGIIIAVMIPIMLQGSLRDGVQTWMPSYISEVFNLDSEIAILTCVAMPIFGVVCNELASFIKRKWFRSELLCAAVIFATASLAGILLSIFYHGNVWAVIVLATILTGCMHGVNVIFTCMLPPYFAYTGKVSFLSGLLNSATYVGSALSGYGFAALSTAFGWQATVVCWAVICVAAGCICFALSKPWVRFCDKAEPYNKH